MFFPICVVTRNENEDDMAFGLEPMTPGQAIRCCEQMSFRQTFQFNMNFMF